MLWRDDSDAGVELSSPPAPEGGAQAPSAPPDLAPVDAPLPAAAAAPVAIPNMLLTGVFGGGPSGGAAIIQLDGGLQRVVPIGREVAPGLKLSGVGVWHAMLTAASGDVRLELGKASSRATALKASMAAPIPSPSSGASGNSDPRRETLQYRLGLEPRRSNGRIGGFAIKAGVTMPALQRAGLRPGDVLVAVNGQAFESEEKVMELSQEIAGSYVAELEFIRDGKRMKASLPVNKRD